MMDLTCDNTSRNTSSDDDIITETQLRACYNQVNASQSIMSTSRLPSDSKSEWAKQLISRLV